MLSTFYKNKKTPLRNKWSFVGPQGQKPQRLNKPQITSENPINIGVLKLTDLITPQKTL